LGGKSKGPFLRRGAKKGVVHVCDQTWMAEKGRFKHSKVLDALLLDVSLLDLIREPSWATSWLVNHADAAFEDVDTLGATLS